MQILSNYTGAHIRNSAHLTAISIMTAEHLKAAAIYLSELQTVISSFQSVASLTLYHDGSFTTHSSDLMGSVPTQSRAAPAQRSSAPGKLGPTTPLWKFHPGCEIEAHKGACLHSSLWTQLKCELCFAGDYRVVTGSLDTISSKV